MAFALPSYSQGFTNFYPAGLPSLAAPFFTFLRGCGKRLTFGDSTVSIAGRCQAAPATAAPSAFFS